MDNKSLIIEKIVKGYITACFWSSCDEEGNYYNELDNCEPSPQFKLGAHQLCGLFYDQNEKDCHQFAEEYQPNQEFGVWECLGQDLWLTSAGHGVGFWSRGLGELGERLTEATKHMIDLDKYTYIGDDQLIYLS